MNTGEQDHEYTERLLDAIDSFPSAIKTTSFDESFNFTKDDLGRISGPTPVGNKEYPFVVSAYEDIGTGHLGWKCPRPDCGMPHFVTRNGERLTEGQMTKDDYGSWNCHCDTYVTLVPPIKAVFPNNLGRNPHLDDVELEVSHGVQVYIWDFDNVHCWKCPDCHLMAIL